MYPSPLTDAAYALLCDAAPLEVGLDERIRAELSQRGAIRVTLQRDRAEVSNMLAHAVREVVYDRLEDAACELVPVAGVVEGAATSGHLVRVWLSDLTTVTAALWALPGDARDERVRVSPYCDAVLVDERAHTFVDGPEVLGIAAAARALRLTEREAVR